MDELPKELNKLVENLCETAMSHGWSKDQGFGSWPVDDEANYKKAKQELVAYLKEVI